jgi:hypothetical protein
MYAGVSGTNNNNPNWPVGDGVLYNRSKVRLTDVADGTANTLMIGEHPPSPDLGWGWCDTALEPNSNGGDPSQSWAGWDMDVVLGVAERGAGAPFGSGPGYSTSESDVVTDRSFACPPVATYMRPGPPATGSAYDTPSNFCDYFHFWSNHTDGAFFCFADASIRFVPYTATAIMTNLATRNGGEVADASKY